MLFIILYFWKTATRQKYDKMGKFETYNSLHTMLLYIIWKKVANTRYFPIHFQYFDLNIKAYQKPNNLVGKHNRPPHALLNDIFTANDISTILYHNYLYHILPILIVRDVRRVKLFKNFICAHWLFIYMIINLHESVAFQKLCIKFL